MKNTPPVDSPQQIFLAVVIVHVPYSLYTQVMLILILIDVQYLQNVVLSLEKGSDDQNHSSSDSLQLIKKFLAPKFSSPLHREKSPLPLNAIWK